MAVYRILEIGEPVLREKAKVVSKFTSNIHKLLDNMAETMYDAKGVGLAAPQIGISKRVIVVDVEDNLIELINPMVVEQEGEETEIEGCLSVPGVQGEVNRAARVTVTGLNREGEPMVYTGEGLLARAFQHEIDHLDGIVFVDKAIRLIDSKDRDSEKGTDDTE
ncbi:MAG: peptide deformylase [Bacillota bacterium]